MNIQELGAILISIQQSFIANFGAYLGLYIQQNWQSASGGLVSPFYPTFFFYVISLLIGKVFIQTLGVAIDTIMQCFIIDEKIQLDRGCD